jgi:hypothetical protein
LPERTLDTGFGSWPTTKSPPRAWRGGLVDQASCLIAAALASDDGFTAAVCSDLDHAAIRPSAPLDDDSGRAAATVIIAKFGAATSITIEIAISPDFNPRPARAHAYADILRNGRRQCRNDKPQSEGC